MNGGRKKGWKPFLLKYIALLMGVCYLANPFHEQITNVFHEISHVLEFPETLISHTQHTHNDYDLALHTDNEHHLAEAEHRHAVLDFMSDVFDASDEGGGENEKGLILIKYDKHISSLDIILPKAFPLYTFHNSFLKVRNVQIGFLNFSDEPPQSASV